MKSCAVQASTGVLWTTVDERGLIAAYRSALTRSPAFFLSFFLFPYLILALSCREGNCFGLRASVIFIFIFICLLSDFRVFGVFISVSWRSGCGRANVESFYGSDAGEKPFLVLPLGQCSFVCNLWNLLVLQKHMRRLCPPLLLYFALYLSVTVFCVMCLLHFPSFVPAISKLVLGLRRGCSAGIENSSRQIEGPCTSPDVALARFVGASTRVPRLYGCHFKLGRCTLCTRPARHIADRRLYCAI